MAAAFPDNQRCASFGLQLGAVIGCTAWDPSHSWPRNKVTPRTDIASGRFSQEFMSSVKNSVETGFATHQPRETCTASRAS